MKADSKWLKKHDRMSVWSKLIEIDKMKAVYYELHVKFFYFTVEYKNWVLKVIGRSKSKIRMED